MAHHAGNLRLICQSMVPTLMSALLLLPHGAFAWSGADEAVWNQFRRERLSVARGLEQEGDHALAGGNAEAALEKYARGLRALGLRGRLGLDGQITPAGYRITELLPDFPGALAGLRLGDILTGIRGVPAGPMNEGQITVTFMRDPGDEMTLAVQRGDTRFVIRVASRIALWNPSNPVADEDALLRLLRSKAASVAGTLKSQPVSAAARLHAGFAQTLAKGAGTAAQFASASAEYRIASLLAPGWSDLYINHALFQEATGDPAGARESLSLYLLAAPASPERDAARAKMESLAGSAGEQAQLTSWEGFWGEIVNNRVSESGIRFERNGRLLTARNSSGFEYLRGTIVDEFTAQALQRFTPQNAGHLGPLIQRCFNGLLEVAGTFRLSGDKRSLTVILPNDFDIDPRSCQLLRNNVASLRYGR